MPITVLQIKLTPDYAETTIIALLINIKFLFTTLVSEIISTVIAENGVGISDDNQEKMYILSYIHLALLVLSIFFIFLIPLKKEVSQMHLEMAK